MFEGKIPEKVITDKSGHKSIQSLRYYERTSVKQDQAAGELINGINKPVIEMGLSLIVIPQHTAPRRMVVKVALMLLLDMHKHLQELY